MTTEAFDRIVKWARVINSMPNNDCKFFYLSDNERAMIIDLSQMKELNPTIKHLRKKEKAYLFIDLKNDKYVRYHAFDVNQMAQVIDPFDGELLMSILEKDILDFIEINIKELTRHEAPFSKIVEMHSTTFSKACPDRPIIPLPARTGSTYTPQGTSHNNYSNYNNNYNLTYKEREKFFDTLYAFIKQGKTTSAIDFINDFMSSKTVEDKDILNDIFKFITLDKLDFISTKQLFKSTETLKESLSDRTVSLTRFKSNVIATKGKKAATLISDI